VFVACSCAFVVRSVGEVAFCCKWFADRLPGCRGLSARHKLLSDCPRVGYGLSIFEGAVLFAR
jgi:hypothetical protein